MPARNAVGLDIGTSSVRAAELSYGRDGITLDKFGQVALPPGAVVDGEVVDRDAVRTALKSLWKGSGFTAKRVALGVANQRVVVRQIDLPWMTRSELKESLALQVQDYLPMAVEDSVLDFHVTEELNGPEGRQLRGLLVAAARETVMSNVAAVQDADLRVTSVDLTSFAVLRSAGRQHSEVATEALLDIGSRVSNLVIHSGGTPRFVRILLSGGQDVTDAVAERLGVPAALAEAIKRGTAGDLNPQEAELAASAVQLMTEVFVDEIRSSLDYYGASNAQFPIERILLSGGGSLLHGLAGHLEQVTRRPVHVADVLGGVRVGRTGLDDEQLAAIHPLAAVPVGLALGVIS